MNDLKFMAWAVFLQLIFMLQVAVVTAIVKWIWTMEYYQ